MTVLDLTFGFIKVHMNFIATYCMIHQAELQNKGILKAVFVNFRVRKRPSLYKTTFRFVTMVGTYNHCQVQLIPLAII